MIRAKIMEWMLRPGWLDRPVPAASIPAVWIMYLVLMIIR